MSVPRASWVVAVGAVLSIAAASVETYLVIESRGDAVARFPKGTVVSRSSPFDLPAGSEVVLLSDTGELRTLRGPVKALPDREATGQANAGALNALASILIEERSGRRVPLVVRGGAGSRATSPWVIDTTRGGVKCLFDAQPAMLWRSGSLARARVSLEAIGSREKVFFDWPAGADTYPWPSEVPRTTGETYLLSAGTAAARGFDLAVEQGEPSPGRALLFMADKRCDDQLALLLAEVARISEGAPAVPVK